MSRAKTLIILSPGFPINEADSTCVPPQQIFVRNLKQNCPGLNIVVLAFQYPFTPAKYQWNGCKVIAFGGRNRSKLYRIFNWVKVWLTLRHLKKQYELIGLLSFWMSDCAFIGNAFAKRNDLRHFCWVLGQDARPSNKYFKWTNSKGNSLIALSDFIARETHENYAVAPAHVIPPGIDMKLFGAASSERDIDILGAGYLIPLKQYHLLVEMIKDLRKSIPDIKALICGDGPEMETLQTLIKSYHLEKNIKLMGELPHADVLALMQRTKVFVHPSSYEGFGVVCLEALYAGAQVVSFVKPMDAVIKNWHIAKDQGDMLNKINSLLENPELDHSSVTPYLIADSCKAMINLFDYKDSAIS